MLREKLRGTYELCNNALHLVLTSILKVWKDFFLKEIFNCILNFLLRTIADDQSCEITAHIQHSC